MTRPEPVRAGSIYPRLSILIYLDTFDLQTSRMANGNVQHKHVDMGFDELGEEEEDVFEDEHDDEDDDGDALSSSPSIPDDVRPCLLLTSVSWRCELIPLRI